MLLLISVLNDREGEEALNGGADILDLKNPAEGSLGAAHPSVVSRIRKKHGGHIPVSVAIGDFPHLPNTAALAALGAATIGADYIKVGLLGSRSEKQVIELLSAIRESVSLQGKKAGIIAAAYADYRETGTINPLLLPSISREARISGCMIDTLNKKGKCLFDLMDTPDLKCFVDKCRELGLLSALAGSLKPEHAGLLIDLSPDIIGLRGTVCHSGNRTSPLAGEKVACFKKLLAENKLQ